MIKVAVLALLLIATAVYSARMDPHMLPMFKSESDVAPYLVELEQAQLDTSDVEPAERPRYVYETLTRWSERTQAPVKKLLDSLGVKYKAYWLTNVIAVQSNISVVKLLGARSDVLHLEANKEFKAILETPETVEQAAPNAVEWNIQWVKADQVWALGHRGTGFVVANADTGVAWRHPALQGGYRGNNLGNINHNYNWWDAVHDGGGNSCGHNSLQPCDDNGHGTHTTGTAVGTPDIGVAPDAKWIACRNMNAGLGTPQRYIECLQFFIAPTDLNGENPNPSLAPHSIGNSYGCPPSEGCAPNALASAVSNVVNAGIFMSVSAGNAGPSCSSVNDPPAIYADSYSVGATGARSHTIAGYSSRGPVTVDNSRRLKPEIVAPGSSVRSAYPPSGYASLSGTSMASPHVTGGIPLLWQARPGLLRNVKATVDALNAAAIAVPSTACSSPGSVPNNVYGHGELDILAAVTSQ